MRRSRNNPAGRRQRGIAVLEFVIALPLIVLIALGVTELGRWLYQYNTLSKAVHNGARYLSDVAIGPLGSINTGPHEAAVRNLVVYGDTGGGSTPVLPGLATGNVTISTVSVTLSGGGISPNHVEVSASYTFTPLFPALSELGASITPSMSASATHRALAL